MPTSSPVVHTATAWRRAIAVWVPLVAWIAYWYRDTATAIWTIWNESQTYAHGYIVVPIAAWLVWRLRQRLAQLTPRSNGWVLPFAVIAALLWLMADLVGVNAATQFAFVALVVLSVPAVFGLDVARAILFPLGFLFFAVPFGDFMLEPLMQATAKFTVLALRMTGIPVYFEGLQLVVPTGRWGVVEACSGVRYLIASVMVGTLFAYLNYRSLSRRLMFVGVAILVPILANWVRAYLIVLIGHLSSNKLAVGVDHLIYGWVFFGIVVFIMFAIGMRWAEESSDSAETPAVRAAVGEQGLARQWSAARSSAVAAGLAMVAMLPHLALIGLDTRDGGAPVELVAPAPATGWKTIDADSVSTWRPAYHGASAEARWGFDKIGAGIGLHLAYYRHQGYDRKLVTSTNTLVSSRSDAWVKVSGGQRTQQVGERSISLRTAVLRGSGVPGDTISPRLVVWQVYWIGGRWVESDALAKIHLALNRLSGRGDDAAVVMVFAPIRNEQKPEDLLAMFLNEHLASVGASLSATRDRASASTAASVAIGSN